jgi:hypothetical protein
VKVSGLATGAAVIAVLLVGCGSDNSPKAIPVATSPATTSSGSDSSATTSGGSDASTTTPTFEGGGSGEFCDFAKDIESSDLANSLGDDSTNLKENFGKIDDVLAKATEKAPSEIKADVETLAAGMKKYEDFLAKYDYDIVKLTEAAQKDPKVLEEATDALSDPRFEEASTRISAYAEQVCAIPTTSS